MKILIYLVNLLTIVFFLSDCDDPLSPTDEHLQLLWKLPLSEVSNSGFSEYDDILLFKTSIRPGGELYKVTKDGINVQKVVTGGCTHGKPIKYNNTIYTNSCDELYALNENDLSVIWKKSNFSWIPIPAADDTYLYVTDKDVVYALEKSTGNTVWSEQIYGKNSVSPAIDGDTLYFATGGDFFKDGFLYSINKLTGRIFYQKLIPYIEANSQKGGSVTGVTIWNNYLFVTSTNRNVYCFNKSTGEQVWKYTADAPIEVTPKVSEDKIYFGTLNRTCYALDVYSGSYIWSFQNLGSMQYEPSFYKNYVMFVENGDVIILDKNSGRKILNLYDFGKVKYGYICAFWDTDGKIFGSGFNESDQQPVLIAFQFK